MAIQNEDLIEEVFRQDERFGQGCYAIAKIEHKGGEIWNVMAIYWGGRFYGLNIKVRVTDEAPFIEIDPDNIPDEELVYLHDLDQAWWGSRGTNEYSPTCARSQDWRKIQKDGWNPME